MAEYDFDLICIGSGPAGQRAAVQGAKLGKRVALIERRRTVGGVCNDTGTIPSKTFREAVLYFSSRTTGRFDRRGPHVSSRPTIEQLMNRVSDVVEIEGQIVEDQLGRNDVTIFDGEASFVDAHTLSIHSDSGVSAVTSENMLIAVGTSPAPPPGVPCDGETILTSDDIPCLKRIPRSMAVIGGGVIGIEYASMFAALGVSVTVVEKRERPIDLVDREIVDELMHQMRDRDVKFRMGEAVDHLEVDPGGLRPQAVLALESGKRIVADVALFSVGRVGATRELNLAAVGLKADDRGRLEVDAQFRTAVPNIFAAGDVIGYPSLAATSSEQGRLAALHAFDFPAGEMTKYFPIGIYAIPEISTVGASEQELTAKKIPYETGVARYREIARGQILGDDSGLFKMLFHRGTLELLGCHAIGTGATELIHIGQAVLVLHGGIDYFMQTVFNYPTLAECYKVAAFDAANKLAR